MGLFGSSVCVLTELYLAIANSVSHSGNEARQTQICQSSGTVGISLAVRINKRPDWNLLPVRAHIRVCVPVCIKGMVSAWQ